MTIALLCPTRGRPEQFKRMCAAANETAESSGSLGVFIDLTEDDEELDGYSQIIPPKKASASPNGCPTVYRWNKLAKHARKDNSFQLFMLASDDMVFTTPLWDEALINHYNSLENKIHVYALQDSRDPEGTPHPIVTREYIDAMGYFLPPIFLHWYCDSWTVEIAKANNCFTHLKDYMLVHDKPSDKGQPDETHNRIRRMGWHKRDKAVNDSCQHFLELEKQRLKIILAQPKEGRSFSSFLLGERIKLA